MHQRLNWITEAVHPFHHHDVGSLVPPIFEAYARVFPPARRRVGGRDLPVSWHEVALANHRTTHPAMEWGSIVGSWQVQYQPGLWDDPPEHGQLGSPETHVLSLILERHSDTDDVTYCLWTGYADFHERRDVLLQAPGAELIDLPERQMYARTGSIGQATELFRGRAANLWFAGDRQWCVATDVDLMSTYVGGSLRCIEAVVRSGSLEAMRVSSDQRVTWDADTVNPLPDPPYVSGGGAP